MHERGAAAYGQLSLPSWPDPRPGTTSPRDDEYPRVTQPQRYRIVQARARVWADALVDVPGVETETLDPTPLVGQGQPGSFDRAIRLSSTRPSTLSLFLLEHVVGLRESADALPLLRICVVTPEITIERVPDCGCDACDPGSAELLRTVDEAIGNVVGGSFVVLRSNGWQAQWHPHGGSSGGTKRGMDHHRAMELSRRLANRERGAGSAPQEPHRLRRPLLARLNCYSAAAAIRTRYDTAARQVVRHWRRVGGEVPIATPGKLKTRCDT